MQTDGSFIDLLFKITLIRQLKWKIYVIWKMNIIFKKRFKLLIKKKRVAYISQVNLFFSKLILK